jgi:hypothetical protein
VEGNGLLSLSFEKKKAWRLGTHPYLAFRVRRSIVPQDDKTRIAVVLGMDEKKSVSVPLTNATSRRYRSVPYPAIPWQSNTWHSVCIDLPEIAKRRLTAKEIENLKVNSLQVRVSKAAEKEELHLQSVFIFAPWGKEDTAVLRGHDVSGMAGLAWQYEGSAATEPVEVKGFTCKPASLPAPPDGAEWLVLRARDRAGNPSAPVRMPLLREPPDASDEQLDKALMEGEVADDRQG